MNTSPSLNKELVAKEREAFEGHLKRINPGSDLRRHSDGEYLFLPVQCHWQGWQARASLLPTDEQIDAARKAYNDFPCPMGGSVGRGVSRDQMKAALQAALASTPSALPVEGADPVAWRKRHYNAEGRLFATSYTGSLDNVPESDRCNLEPLYAAVEEPTPADHASIIGTLAAMHGFVGTPSKEGAACPKCNGSGVVDDGEIDCYEGGMPYANGPVKCVKDCPACTGKKAKEGAGDLTPAELGVVYSRWLASGNDSLYKLMEEAIAAAQEKAATAWEDDFGPDYTGKEGADIKPLDDPHLQQVFGDCIEGALALGFQGTNAPPEGHWLWRFWDIGRNEAKEATAATVEVQSLIAELDEASERITRYSNNPMDGLLSAAARMIERLAASTAIVGEPTDMRAKFEAWWVDFYKEPLPHEWMNASDYECWKAAWGAATLAKEGAAQVEAAWLPTPENINALPAPVRDYIHGLVANCDPAGMVRENAQLRDTNEGLQRMYRNAAEAQAVAEVVEELEHDGVGFCAKVRWLVNPVPVGEHLRWGSVAPTTHEIDADAEKIRSAHERMVAEFGEIDATSGPRWLSECTAQQAEKFHMDVLRADGQHFEFTPLASPSEGGGEPVGWLNPNTTNSDLAFCFHEEKERLNLYAHTIPVYDRPSRGEAVDARYQELLYAVARKHPSETRHQTALRYIRQAEASTGEKQAAQSQGAKP